MVGHQFSSRPNAPFPRIVGVIRSRKVWLVVCRSQSSLRVAGWLVKFMEKLQRWV